MPMSNSSANSQRVKWWFPRITARIFSKSSSFVDVEVLPDLRISPTDILPSLKCLNHSFQCVRLIQSSPYVRLSNWNVSVIFVPSLQQNFQHQRYSSRSFIVTLSLIRRTACARAQFNGCSSAINDQKETGQIAVYCQNLRLGSLCSLSALSMLIGALFRKFCLFLSPVEIILETKQNATSRVNV